MSIEKIEFEGTNGSIPVDKYLRVDSEGRMTVGGVRVDYINGRFTPSSPITENGVIRIDGKPDENGKFSIGGDAS